MSGTPTSEVPPPPERPLVPGQPPPPDSLPPSAGERQRSKRTRILTPLALAGAGVLLFLLAILLYPSAATDVPTPSYPHLGIVTNYPADFVGLSTFQVSPAITEMRISVELTELHAHPTAGILVSLPLGTAFQDCPAGCQAVAGPARAYVWDKTLAFRDGKATADFFVKAHNFGVAYDGVAAAAAIPDVNYQGPGTPLFLIAYNIPSAASYDWSSFAPAAVNNQVATWQEDLTSGETAGRAAFGINPAGQASHDNKTFIAGALVGLAGAAILSAIQEALHAGD